jgi:hypothetical protein
MSEDTLALAAAALDHWDANKLNMPARELVKRLTDHILDEARAVRRKEIEDAKLAEESWR